MMKDIKDILNNNANKKWKNKSNERRKKKSSF